MAQADVDIPQPVTSGATDNPDAKQSGTPAGPWDRFAPAKASAQAKGPWDRFKPAAATKPAAVNSEIAPPAGLPSAANSSYEMRPVMPTSGERVGKMEAAPGTGHPDVIADTAEKMAQTGAKYGREAGAGWVQGASGGASGMSTTPRQEPLTQEQSESQHPIVTGAAEAVGGTVGGIVADPRQWPLLFLGEGVVAPAIEKLISGAFAVHMSKEAIEGAKVLAKNWDKMTPEQRSEQITNLGLTSAFAGMAGFHAGAGKAAKAGFNEARDIVSPVPETEDVKVLDKERIAAQEKYDAAKAAMDRYKHGLAQGVPAPPKVQKAYDAASNELALATFHHEAAIDAANKAIQERRNPTPKTAPATADIPAEKIEAKPQVQPMQTFGKPQNVKGPGEVTPEVIAQSTTERPMPTLGQKQLPNDQGRMGKTLALPEARQKLDNGEVIPPERGLTKIPTPQEEPVTIEAGRKQTKEAATPVGEAPAIEMPASSIEKPVDNSLVSDLLSIKGSNPELVGSQATGKATPDSDVDLKLDLSNDRFKAEAQPLLESKGYEWQGSSVVTPKEAAAYDKPIREGWSRVEHFKDSSGKRLDVWLSEEEPSKIKPADLEKQIREGLGGTEQKPNEPIAKVPEKVSSDPRKAVLQKAKATDADIATILQRGGKYDPTSKVGLSKLAEHFGVDLGTSAVGRGQADIAAGTHVAPADVLQKIMDAGHSPADIAKAVSEGKHLPKVGGASQGYEGEERRGLKTPEMAYTGADRRNPFKDTEGARETIKNDPNMPKHPAEEAKTKQELAAHADKYNKAEGLPKVNLDKVEKSPRGAEIAKEYEAMKHDPDNPEVKKSYKSLVDDVKKQWDYAKKMGIEIEPTDKDPYKSYEEMRDDVKNNKRLQVWRGGNPLPEDHPLAAVDPKTGENYNTMFRAVHDLFGHVVADNDFSEPGEENAWNMHRQTMQPDSIPAMTTETRGQTSWFFNHEGKPGVFAEQKAGILPDFANEPTPDAKAALDHIKSGKDYAVLTAENPNNTRVSPEENAKRNRELVADLKKKGYEPIPVEGNNKDVEGRTEHSYLVKDIPPKEAAELGRKHGQESVLTTEGLHHLDKDVVNPSDNAKLMTGDEAKKQDYSTKVGDQDFSVPIDFNKEVKPGGGTEKPEITHMDRGNGLHEVFSDRGENRIGQLLAQDVEGKADTVQVATHWVAPEERGKGTGAAQLEKLAQSLPDSKKILLSDDEMTASARGAWDKFQSQYPDAVTKTDKGYSVDLAKMRGEHLPTVSGGKPAAGTAEAKELPDEAEKHLTDEEKASISKSAVGRKNFSEGMAKVPALQEWVDAAKGGEGARHWYQRSGKAFDALHEEAPKYFQEGDREKWGNFVAALSPRQMVHKNLAEAIHAWTQWVDDGRPTDDKAMEKSLRDAITAAPDTKIPNAMKALKGEDLWPDLSKNRNFKVPSFGKNLNGYLNYSTNDGWQALFGGLSEKQVVNPSSYHPLSVMTRAAAEALGWETAEAQAAIWSFTQALKERGEVDPQYVRDYSEDFADIMAHNPDIRQQLKSLGVDLGKLDKKLEAIGEKPQVTAGASRTTEHSTRQLAARIEKARGEGSIPEPKRQQELFRERPANEHRSRIKDESVEFDPNKFHTSTDVEEMGNLGKKKGKSPLKKM